MDLLAADCSRCFALCCSTLELTAGSDFAIDKPAGTPCPHLDRHHGCRIHPVLRDRGFSGCAAYDCFGAGQQVSALLSGPRDPRAVDVFPVMRVLHELRWHVREAGLEDPELDELAAGSIDELLALDLDAVWDRVDAVLVAEADRVRGDGRDLRGEMLVGADLAGQDLTGASLRGARAVSADLSGAVLSGADLTGTDLRRADLGGADLRGAQLLTQSQLDSAQGDGATLLPDRLRRPGHWSR